MESIDDLKRLRRAKIAITRKKTKEAVMKISEIDETNTVIYVNGEALNITEHCKVVKAKLSSKE